MAFWHLLVSYFCTNFFSIELFEWIFIDNYSQIQQVSEIKLIFFKILINLIISSADGDYQITTKTKAIVHYDGRVVWEPPMIYKSYCSIDIEYYPFDIQNCYFKFGSWTYDETNIILRNKSSHGQLDSYIKNGEWFLEGVNSYSKTITYECCVENYPFVMFEIYLRRRTLYFIVNLIFPCILISFMTVVGFSLPPDSGDKLGLGEY